VSASGGKPRRLRRSESFLGVHFDFHARDDCTEVGKNVTAEMVERIIDLVQPDFLQCDGKGHPGLASYPTKVGYAAPGFVRDPLRIWRDVTASRGVALYVHYSGVQDVAAVKHNPGWARIDEKGEPDERIASVFSPFADELLICQLKEIIDEYDVDGVWIDGDCWSTRHDYGETALQRFREETGITDVPRSPDDPHYHEFTEFCRDAFREYQRHYIDALHEHNANFQICNNWAYCAQMPEAVNANVDYLSGDVSCQDSIQGARLDGRYMANQGKPWDLMSWGFPRGGATKPPLQLQQEAAVVISLGGAYQVYFRQKRDGSISDWEMNVMAEVASFCRARQSVCFGARAVPQIGLLNSTANFYRKANRLFPAVLEEDVPLPGILSALLDAQQAVEVLAEHHLRGRMQDYPLLIVPECSYLEPEFRQELVDYVKAGGSMLAIGPSAAALFEEDLDVELTGEPGEQARWIETSGHLTRLDTTYQPAELGATAQPFGKLYVENDLRTASEPAAVVTPCGAGRIAATVIDLDEHYYKSQVPAVRDLLHALVRELFPRPLVEVSGSHSVDVIVTRIDGKLAVNLVNTAGPHHDPTVPIYDNIPPAGPLAITIRTGERPTRVTREPGGDELPFDFSDGKVSLELPRLEIHDVIVVEQPGTWAQ